MSEPISQFGLKTILSADLDSILLPTLMPGTISAWCGHIPFAHWCVQRLRPSLIVELGTHNGISYSAFCSAVKRYEIPARCFAVDTWQGDSQAGQYGDQIFDAVRDHNDQHFSDFSSLLRMTFDEALGQIEDGSVDLLHIDGFHSYDAVRHDFETWRCKLSSRAVVLFHDTHERQEGFGVWKYWEEIRTGFPWFEFNHSHGLGVLAVGPEAPPAILALCELTGSADGKVLQERFAAVGARWEVESYSQMQREAMNDLHGQVRDAHKKFEQANASIGPTRKALQTSEENLVKLKKEITRLRSRLKGVLGSSSWRLTAPLRAASETRALAAVVKSEDLRELPQIARSPARLKQRLRDLKAIKLIGRSALFDQQWYREQYRDNEGAATDPVRHYVMHGAREGRHPSPRFDSAWYLSQYADVASAGMNPLAHYLISGQAEGRLPLPPGKHVLNPEAWASAADLFPAGTRRLEQSVARHLADIDGFRESVRIYQQARADRDPAALKIAVITATVGRYDSVKQPDVLNPAIDYFLFTDTPLRDAGIWQIRPIPYFGADNTRSGRYIKTHLPDLLKGYDIGIWVDSNIQLQTTLTPVLEEFLASGHSIASIPHPMRNSMYDEADACLMDGKDEAKVMQAQVAQYEQEGFSHADLIESNVLFADLRNPATEKFFRVWWREIDRYSRRDQLSINYSLREAGLSWHPLCEKGLSARELSYLALVSHDSGEGVSNLLAEASGGPLVDPYQMDSFRLHKDAALNAVTAHTVDIVVCVHNALDDVRLCLASVERWRQHIKSTLIVVDDGSAADTAQFLSEFAASRDWVKLLRRDEPTGYTKAANRGMNESTAELVVMLNSDTIVTEHWTEKLAHAVFTTTGAGVVSALSNAASHQSIPSHQSANGQTAVNALPPGYSPQDMNALCEQWAPYGFYPQVPLAHGFCIGVTRDLLTSIGGFDEESFPHGYGEENDLCLRAADAGFGLVIAVTTFVYHSKSKSYPTDTRLKLMAEGSETLHRLHGNGRVGRAVKAMQHNPVLQKFRDLARLNDRMARAALPTVYVFPALAGPTTPTGSAYVRLLQPLADSALASRLNIETVVGKVRVLPSPGSGQAVYLQRDVTGVAMDAYGVWAQAWQAAGGKIFYDIDDDLLDTDGLKARTGWSDQKILQIQQRVNSFAASADLITVSTEPLAKRFDESGKPVRVIPNQLDDDLWMLGVARANPGRDIASQPVRIGYIGTPSHDQDLAVIAPAIRKLEARFGAQINVEVIGAFRGKQPQFGRALDHGKANEYPDFVRWLLANVDWDIGLIPLHQDSFNQSKSDLKFLEYAALGLGIVCSDANCYASVARHEQNALVVENSEQAWVDAITRLIEDRQLRQSLAKNARSAVKQNRSVGTNSKQFAFLGDLKV